jgi:hypothetical protein
VATPGCRWGGGAGTEAWRTRSKCLNVSEFGSSVHFLNLVMVSVQPSECYYFAYLFSKWTQCQITLCLRSPSKHFPLMLDWTTNRSHFLTFLFQSLNFAQYLN